MTSRRLAVAMTVGILATASMPAFADPLRLDSIGGIARRAQRGDPT